MLLRLRAGAGVQLLISSVVSSHSDSDQRPFQSLWLQQHKWNWDSIPFGYCPRKGESFCFCDGPQPSSSLRSALGPGATCSDSVGVTVDFFLLIISPLVQLHSKLLPDLVAQLELGQYVLERREHSLVIHFRALFYAFVSSIYICYVL